MATFNVIEEVKSRTSDETAEISWGKNLNEISAASSVAMILARYSENQVSQPSAWDPILTGIRIEVAE